MATGDLLIENVGPVEHLSIPVPEGGGIIVLQGRNGSGKTHVIESVGTVLGANHKPPVADGASRGRVEGWGARINVSSRLTRKGTLLAESLEGKLDLAALVDPGLKDVDAADAKRIRALLAITGTQPDKAKFCELGIDDDVIEYEPGDDIVTAAGRIKRSIENKARMLEKQATKLHGEADGMRSGCEGIVSIEPEVDVSALNQELEVAIERRAYVHKQVVLATQHRDARAKAQKVLSDIGSASADDVRHRLESLLAKEHEMLDAIEALHRRLEIHRKEMEATSKELEREQAKADKLQQAREVLDTQTVDMPSIEVQEDAAKQVSEARESIERATIVNATRRTINEANEKDRKAAELATEAERLRDAAKATDEMLSDAVSYLGVPLTVKAGRLVTTTSRGVTPFAELSHGERWKLALDIGVRQVGEDGVLAIPQEAWEGLDPDNRRMLSNHARRQRVVVFTAEATDGELSWEQYE